MSQHEERGERGWRVRARAAGSRVGGAVKGAWGLVRAKKLLFGTVAFALLAVVVAVPELVRNRIDAIRTNLLSWGPYDEGLILLNTPQVFTRGRLVHDRAIEAAWLARQLGRTNDLIEKERFGQPSFARAVQRRLTAILAQGDKPAVSVNDETLRRLATTNIKPAPTEQFKDASAYRDEIRNRQLSTILDDRHDIEGNTVYRLNFTATVVPTYGSDRLAVAVVELLEAQDESNLDARYVEVVYDWAEKLEAQLSQILSDRLRIIERQALLTPHEAYEFDHWLRNELEYAVGPGASRSPSLHDLLLKGASNNDLLSAFSTIRRGP